jgi:aminopeptidase N
VVVNIGNYQHYSEIFKREKDSMQLHYYYLPYNEEPAKKIFGRTRELLSFFERSFGEYPFKNDGFTLMEALYPMEHQGAVSMGSINNPFFSDKIDYREVTRTAWHEAAHEWWGNNITGKDIADIWIHEAFATYAEAMVYEFFDGRSAAEKLLRQQVPGNKEPVIGHYGVNDFRLGDVYPKGCMMLHTLRNVIDNDSVWFDLLRGLQTRFRYKTVTTEDIVDHISMTLNKDYRPFFDQYLRHAAIPELQLKFKQGNSGLEIQYRWKTDEKGFDMPVKVTVQKNKFDFIYPGPEWKTITIKDMKMTDFKTDTESFLVRVTTE